MCAYMLLPLLKVHMPRIAWRNPELDAAPLLGEEVHDAVRLWDPLHLMQLDQHPGNVLCCQLTPSSQVLPGNLAIRKLSHEVAALCSQCHDEGENLPPHGILIVYTCNQSKLGI